MATTARSDLARYQRGALDHATPARPCNGCGRGIHFIKHPESHKPQALDCELRSFVLEDGRVMRGYASHWSTCTNPPTRASTTKGADADEPRQAPRKVEAEAPAASKAPAPQLSLLAPQGSREVLMAGAKALADATVSGHYDASIRSSIIAAVMHPKRELEISVAAVTGHAGERRTESEWSKDMERLRALRTLTIDDQTTDTNQQRVFLIAREDQRRIQGHVRQGTEVLLRLHPAVVARFLGAAVAKAPEPPRMREPGEDDT